MSLFSSFRFTKVIFTIGPSTLDVDVLRRLLRSGVDICRVNMAHASHDWTYKAIKAIRTASVAEGKEVSILMDIKGPEIRTGYLDGYIQLEKDQQIDLTQSDEASPEAGIPAVDINYPSLIDEAKIGDVLLVDSGLMRFQVEEVLIDRLRCRVIIPGKMGSRRHINIPGKKINLPAMTEKDIADTKIGISANVDFFALSFVREAADINQLKKFLLDNNSAAQVVAKVEDQSGIKNLKEILDVSDALMVARGDLGIEVPYEELPIIQKQAVSDALISGKPVIMATHLLESMIESPMPTRAEITDVSNSVFERVDCVMLSGETSVGKYPVECVDVLNKVTQNVERYAGGSGFNESLPLSTTREKLMKSAVVLARELGGVGIVVFSSTGLHLRTLAALRPFGCPIFVFTEKEKIIKDSKILWGVKAFLVEFKDSQESTISDSIYHLQSAGYAEKGDQLIVVPNLLFGGVDMVQVRDV
ncbi:MAG: pyruvate kinase [Opitutia bacterium TMED67]|nr:pyruvate kinase [Verrucomicrobiales bacterium]OUU73581.1 MAG: pyruvate kinase [Opitutae bacterium TMED67]RZO60619.1 MAG: pyruvate kinase [Limisphaerales bacterium]